MEKQEEKVKSDSELSVSSDSSDNEKLQRFIGGLCPEEKTPTKIVKIIDSVSEEEKYDLLTNYKKPEPDHVFPRTENHKCFRAFQHNWFFQYAWLAYCIFLDGAFCIPCMFFATQRENKGEFVIRPLRNWYKFLDKARDHNKSDYHINAVSLAAEYISKRNQPSTSITAQLDSKRKRNIEKNRKILKTIIQAILFC